MTVIVAVRDPKKGTIVMGCDSRMTTSGTLAVPLPKARSKIFPVSHFLIGFAGAMTIRNIVSRLVDSELRFGPKGPTSSFDLETVLIDLLIPQFKGMASAAKIILVKEGIEHLRGSLMVAIGDQMCVVGNDFSVVPFSGDYGALGTGERLALGSLATSEKMDMSPRRRVRLALEVAALFENTVGPPFLVHETKPFSSIRK